MCKPILGQDNLICAISPFVGTPIHRVPTNGDEE